jgi:hypothetical protein
MIMKSGTAVDFAIAIPAEQTQADGIFLTNVSQAWPLLAFIVLALHRWRVRIL